MSLYKFFCRKCKKIHNGIFPMGKVPTIVRCPKCRAKMERFLEMPNVQFRGKGFYSTDNA